MLQEAQALGKHEEAGETLQGTKARILKEYHVICVGNAAFINTNGSHLCTQEEGVPRCMHKHSCLSRHCSVPSLLALQSKWFLHTGKDLDAKYQNTHLSAFGFNTAVLVFSLTIHFFFRQH